MLPALDIAQWLRDDGLLTPRHRSKVRVIPTAGVEVHGTGQRLEGSLVERSAGLARAETTFMARCENGCAFLTGGKRRVVLF